MQKFLEALGSFFLSLFQGNSAGPSTYEKIIDDIFERSGKILGRAALALFGVLIIVSGLLASYFNLLNQYDQTGSVAVGAVASGGLVLVLIGLGLVFAASRKSMTEKILGHGQAENKSEASASPAVGPSTLEQAMALLILDFVEERKQERELKKNQFDPQPKFSHDEEEFTIQ